MDPEVTFLNDGGQDASSVLERLVAFINEARTSLDLAVYDAHLESPLADKLLGAFDDARTRGVTVRAVYNDDHRKHAPVPPPAAPSSPVRAG